MKILELCRNSGILLLIVICSSCNKDWLNAKPNKALVIPTTIADYQALLDNTDPGMNSQSPGLSMVGDGDFIVTDASYAALSQVERSTYIWAPTENFFGGQGNADWALAYSRILNDNVALDGIQSINIAPGSQTAYNNVKGSALFYRCFDFYNLAQEYCKVYLSSTASTDLGLPLRTSPNINLTVTRASLQQTYDQIINDLLAAAPMLPVTPLFPTRPSKPAVFGLLSRVYLSQQNYSKAFLYADSCLQIQNGLMDFNQLDPTLANPILQFNKEVIYSCTIGQYLAFRNGYLVVDSTLLNSYAKNDLRNTIYFFNMSGYPSFQGTYSGNSYALFSGIATDEMYLTRAECYARAGNSAAALNDLNTLLKNRFVTGTYNNAIAANADSALSVVLKERRKELCFRGLRWTDLRRLNLEQRFQTTLKRTVSGQIFTLPPNSPMYVLPLDPIEIQLGGLQQNPR